MELSLVATFDELRRCQDVLTDGTAEVGKLHANWMGEKKIIVQFFN